MDTLGATVQRIRQERGWTQEELAARLNLSQRWVSDVENGRTTMPRLDKLRRLADVLGVDRGVLVLASDYTDRPDLADAIGGEPPGDPRAELHARIDAALGPAIDYPKVVDAIIDNITHTVEMWQAFSQQPPAGEPAPRRNGAEPVQSPAEGH